MTTPLLQMTNIEKKFGSVTALSAGKLTLNAGEIHALLGANGAGKSTLIKILSGVYGQNAGEILLDGQLIELKSPRAAKQAGIFTVYQEVDTAIVPELSIAENIMLDTFSMTKKLFVSPRDLNKKAQQAFDQLNAEPLDLTKPAFQLTLAEKQLVLIARALVQKAKIIIFDEPTAPLSVKEATRLFDVMYILKAQGVASIFISHRLAEVFEISDYITVMREGRHVITKNAKDTNQHEVIESMLGSAFEMNVKHKDRSIGDVLLQVEDVSDGNKVRSTSFTVGQGEIVGIVGLVGAGKTELAKLLFGASRLKKGHITLNNKLLKLQHPRQAIDAGIVLVPEERRKEGLFIEESIRINTSFPNLIRFATASFMRAGKERDFADEVIRKLRVKATNSEKLLVHLSGGNQQKVAIGKWLSHDANVYLFDEPTKGVDIGAKVDIFNIIQDCAAEGKGIVYLSSEIHEILLISDRILVMYDGRIVNEMMVEDATQEKILLYASGGKEELHEG